MPERLGNVLYWVGCTAALGWLGFWAIVALTMQGAPLTFWIIAAVPSIAIWALGRAARYVISGA